ncbi:hypothetical protein V6N13_060772 [Hibiscus sabdariffa]|uniref:Uncharacterized protein n=1 Tax=Hibiscus sabdariffa TaxID=183260 RepID=A0ABR2P6N7_9ROSI
MLLRRIVVFIHQLPGDAYHSCLLNYSVEGRFCLRSYSAKQFSSSNLWLISFPILEPLCNNEILSGKQRSRQSFNAHSNGAVFAAELYHTLGKNNFTAYSSSPKSFSNLVSRQGQFIGFALTAVAIAPNDQFNASLKTEMQ